MQNVKDFVMFRFDEDQENDEKTVHCKIRNNYLDDLERYIRLREPDTEIVFEQNICYLKMLELHRER